MDGFPNNGACVLAYLELFQALASPEAGGGACAERWEALRRREAASPEDVPLAPPVLAERFGLTERDFLLAMAALAMELDGGLRGAFRNRYGLSLPTLEYGLQLIEPICPSGVETPAELAGPNPLTSLLLLPSGEEGYSVERPLVLCRGPLAFLTGFALAEVRRLTFRTAAEEALPLHQDALEEVRAWYASGNAPLYLAGPEGSGRRTLLCRACGGAACVEMEDAAALPAQDRRRVFQEAAAASRLLAGPVCAVHGGGSALRELAELCRAWSVPLAVLGEPEGEGEAVRLQDRLTPGERDAAWRTFLPEAERGPGGAMTIGALRETAELSLRYARASGRKAVLGEDVRRAVRSRAGTVEFAVFGDASASLDDMVLPEPVRDQLERICREAEHSAELSAWGLPRAREGVTAVFHGPSGTGKTMAAGAIAGRLGLPLLRADLSQVMDKYVGETEKHLARLFRCARENRCVLFFDEADALFSKRGEAGGGQDKYANLSTAYLLQEIERYEGVALLSTNLLRSFDEAFLRRLRYVVRFPLPDAAARETLWRRALPEGRLAEDAPCALLAQAELSPARILGAARTAAVEAIAAGRRQVDGALLVRAARLELEKDGKPLPGRLRGFLENGREGGADGTGVYNQIT